jgi:hypothetical protein
MTIKLEHTCSRCKRVVRDEMSDVAAAQASEALDAKRAKALADLQEFVATIDPELLPDLFIVRRGADVIHQTYLCDADDAKRSCVKRIQDLVTECETLAPRKPKTKKTPPPAAPEAKDSKPAAKDAPPADPVSND